MRKGRLPDPSSPQSRARDAMHWFSTIYLGGIPPIITNDSAFLAFICCVTATEALSGYRYADPQVRRRFVRFVREYFPEVYMTHAEALYEMRNKLVHAFSTGSFKLIHHRSDMHLRVTPRGDVILNAKDVYAALLTAAQKYFGELRASSVLQDQMVRRLDSEGGGTINVGPVAVM